MDEIELILALIKSVTASKVAFKPFFYFKKAIQIK